MIHVHYKPLWAAVGEPDTRLRKPAPQGRMIERVMLLDAVLDEPTCTWLGSGVGQAAIFHPPSGEPTRRPGISALTFGDGPEKTVRYFPDKLPIGVLPGLDHHAFVCLVTNRSAANRSSRFPASQPQSRRNSKFLHGNEFPVPFRAPPLGP